LPADALRTFEVVDHLNFGRELITDKDERTGPPSSMSTPPGHPRRRPTPPPSYVASLRAFFVTTGGKELRATIEAFRQRAELRFTDGNFDRCGEIVAITLTTEPSPRRRSLLHADRAHTLLPQFKEALHAAARRWPWWVSNCATNGSRPVSKPWAGGGHARRP
jgi:hypothetical protein